jgi:hypothetical protein
MDSVGKLSALEISKRIMNGLAGPPDSRAFDVCYWDGSLERSEGEYAAQCTIILRHPWSLRRLLLPPTESAAAEAYFRDDIDVDGDMEQAMSLVQSLRPYPFACAEAARGRIPCWC